MILKFNDFIKEEFIHSQTGKKLPNGNLASIEDVYYEIGDGCDENATVEDITDDFDINSLNAKFDNFVSVVALMDINKGEMDGDYVYVIQGDEHNGYTYEQFDHNEL